MMSVNLEMIPLERIKILMKGRIIQLALNTNLSSRIIYEEVIRWDFSFPRFAFYLLTED